jgi:tetratricopeptide (TPR) repeat protein
VTALLDDGERRVNELAAHPERQARLWRVLGQMHAARGAYVRAQALLKRAWDAQRAQRGDNDAVAARTYHELAMARSHFSGGDATSRLMLDSSLERLRRVLGDGHRDVVSALQDRASVATSLAEQRTLLGQAATLQQRQSPQQAPDSAAMEAAALLNNQGTAHFASGALSDARKAFEGTLRILEQQLPAGHPARLATTRNLAAVLSQLGEWAASEKMVRGIIARDSLIDADSVSAGDLENLGLLAAHQDRLPEAEAHLHHALRTLRAQLDSDHWRIDNTLRNLGLVIIARGRVADGLRTLDSAVSRARARPEGAESRGYGYMTGQRVRPLLRLGRANDAVAAMHESERVFRRIADDNDAYLADVAQWRGELALSQGEFVVAERALRDALRRTVSRLPAGHPKLAGVKCLLGVSLFRQRRYAEAREKMEESCEAYSRWGLADSMTLGWARVVRSPN